MKGTQLVVMAVMTGIQKQEVESVDNQPQFHLTDLVPRDCCQTERVDLETKLRRLEQSLSSWLREKIGEIESVPSVTINDNCIASRERSFEQEAFMSKDERDILELLRTELDFLEKGGYGRSVRTPWKPTSPFRDSLTCVNYALPEKAHPCSECHLIDFVPPGHRADEVPCHYIPLNAEGDTAEDLEGDQSKLEEALKAWLRLKIKEIEASRLAAKQGV